MGLSEAHKRKRKFFFFGLCARKTFYKERMFHGLFVHGSECSRERIVLRTNVPDTVFLRSIEHLH